MRFFPQALKAQRIIIAHNVEEIKGTKDVNSLVSAVGEDDSSVYEVGKTIIKARTRHAFEDNAIEKEALSQFRDHINSKYHRSWGYHISSISHTIPAVS